ncbi:MAG: response regulator [Pseudomonadota bacterium]
MTTAAMHPRILIVDDEAAHMRALCDTLRDHDYDTTGFVSGDAALAALAALAGESTASFDLLLTDLMMPEIDGITLVQAARNIDPDLACIIMTGEGSITTAVRAMKVGALDYIIKPFKVSAILPVLSRALETRQLRLENAKLEQRLREHAVELDAVNKDLDLARKQAESANRAKSTFLSNMSHELRTPLNAILGFSQILTSDTLPSTLAEKKEYATDIMRAGTHLLTLINEILDLAKVESGTMTLSMEAVALDEVFQECGTMIEPLANKRGIQVRFAEHTGIHLLADRTRLKQVLINLLSNAIKYNREHGKVSVECEPAEAGRVRIAVQDTGVGLDAKQLEAIFQPFNRLGQEAFDEEGTGIGLALTKRLVEEMQGGIDVASTLGVGSTFTIELAACDPIEPQLLGYADKIKPRVHAVQKQLSRKTLLYVEDNPANLKLVAELIRLRADLDLLSAGNAYHGIELARLHMPHVILMDINLPGMDGIEATRKLRDDPKTAGIPVIAITAGAMPSDVKKGMAAGFFRYLTKPIDINTFTEAVDSALGCEANKHKE